MSHHHGNRALGELVPVDGEIAGIPAIQYEGDPWLVATSPFAEFQAETLRKVAIACGLTAPEQARLIGAKQCLSCGAYQTITGDLPCDH